MLAPRGEKFWLKGSRERRLKRVVKWSGEGAVVQSASRCDGGRRCRGGRGRLDAQLRPG